MKRKIVILISFFILFWQKNFAQNYIYPINNFSYQLYQKHLNLEKDTFFHTIVKPLQIDLIENYSPLKQRKKYNSKILKKIFNEDLVSIEKEDLTIKGNLLFELWKGKEDTSTIWQNTRGFNIYGNIGKKIYFYTDFFENQAVFPTFINEKITQSSAVIGRANWKDFGERGKDFNYASGFITWNFTKKINFQLGLYKIFIGEGYRSLFLSDNSYSMPNLKITFQNKHFAYYTIFAETYRYQGRYYSYHSKRHLTIQVLSYANKFSELSFFEGILWKTSDDSTYIKKFPTLFFVPIIFAREPFLGLNNEHNMILGVNYKLKPFNFSELYTQYILDDVNKYGYQIGFKIYNLFFSKKDKFNFFIQGEYNYVKPFTYKHYDAYQAWAHYNQPLAHPIGSGFEEKLFLANLKLYNFTINFLYNNILTSEDFDNFDTGVNILQQETNFQNEKPGWKNPVKIHNKQITISYIINYKTNLQLFITYQMRDKITSLQTENTSFYYFGLRTNLYNFYYDF